MSSDTNLPLLPVSGIFVIAQYGWKQSFSDIHEAIRYVTAITDMVEDPATPIDQIQVMVEFETGDSERCSYQEKQRTIQWLKRFSD